MLAARPRFAPYSVGVSGTIGTTMPIERWILVPCDGCLPLPGRLQGAATGVVATLADSVLLREAVDAVVTACRGEDAGMAGRLSTAGLRAELTDRPGRHHRVWIATVAGEAPLGLACLARVEAGSGGVRFSLSWLLVHPRWRRRGVGRLLVGHALADARCCGADQVHVETRADWPDAAAFWKRLAIESGCRAAGS